MNKYAFRTAFFLGIATFILKAFVHTQNLSLVPWLFAALMLSISSTSRALFIAGSKIEVFTRLLLHTLQMTVLSAVLLFTSYYGIAIIAFHILSVALTLRSIVRFVDWEGEPQDVSTKQRND